MNLRDLHYFEVIAACDTYDEAADRLGRTKPALTKAVQRLESAVEGKLFERAGRGKTLTPTGRVLLAKASSVSKIVSDMQRDVRGYARGMVGVIRIGTGTTPADLILPPASKRFSQLAPGVRIELVIGMADELYESLRKGEVDLIVCPVGPDRDSEFDTRSLQSHEVVVAAGADNPLVGNNFALEALVDYQWVLPSRSVSTRTWLDNVFTSCGLPAPIAKVETNSLSALPRLVEQMGLLTFTGRGSLQGLKELVHPLTTLRRDFAVSIKKNRYVPPAIETFAQVLQGFSTLEARTPHRAGPDQESA